MYYNLEFVLTKGAKQLYTYLLSLEQEGNLGSRKDPVLILIHIIIDLFMARFLFLILPHARLSVPPRSLSSL